MRQFIMPYENTCAECGTLIEVGEIVYAESLDAVLSGQGIDKACMDLKQQKADAIAEIEADARAKAKALEESASEEEPPKRSRK